MHLFIFVYFPIDLHSKADRDQILVSVEASATDPVRYDRPAMLDFANHRQKTPLVGRPGRHDHWTRHRAYYGKLPLI